MDEFCLENIDGFFPELLSAGQLKTVAVARALISEPDMLLLDEPLSGVDPFTARKIMNVIYEHQNRRKMSVIMVSHETDLWEGFLPVKKVLDKGRLVDSSEQENTVESTSRARRC
jgi:energy-coupling factor transporter ATP-binding protein EcfA2